MAQETVSLATTDYQTIGEVAGPLLFVSKVKGASYGEMVEIHSVDGSTKFGQVIEMSGELAVVQVFGPTAGLDTKMTSVRFSGEVAKMPCSANLLGRVLDGMGQPRDGGPEIFAEEEREIIGAPINPWSRDEPRDFIQTGICAIDGLNTLVRGQKLPIFSGAGLPGNELAALIVKNAKIDRGRGVRHRLRGHGHHPRRPPSSRRAPHPPAPWSEWSSSSTWPTTPPSSGCRPRAAP